MMLSQFATIAGDGSGNIDAVGDYSSAAVRFLVQPPQDEAYQLARMLVLIRDTGITAERYGGIAGGLTNGIRVDVRREDEIVADLLGGQRVKTNADWGRFCYDVQLHNFGSGDDYIGVRWTFSKSGAPISLSGHSGMRLCITLNDDMTSLLSHTFLVQGQKRQGTMSTAETMYPVTEPS